MAEPSLIANSVGSRWAPAVPRSRLLRGLRLLRFGGALTLGLLVLVPPHLLWLWLSRGAPSPVARVFHRLICWSIGLRVRVSGVPIASNALILANHISWTDILVLGATTPTRFVAKTEVRSWPFLGWLASLNPALFIDRDARCGVRNQIGAIAAALDQGPVALFPEGTTGSGAAVLPFNPSLIAGADDRPVQPVSIRYRPRHRSSWPAGALAAFAWDGDKPFLPHFLDVIGGAGVEAYVVTHAPILTGDRKSRTLAAREIISRALEPR